jgi:hypothetical protein
MKAVSDLAELVVSQCPPAFKEAILKAELDEDWAQIELRYWTIDGHTNEVPLKGIAMADLHDALDSIREQMANQSGQRWETCTLSIERNGKFMFEVSYDPPARSLQTI